MIFNILSARQPFAAGRWFILPMDIAGPPMLYSLLGPRYWA